MERAHWKRVQALFHAATERPAGERETFVRKACGGDEQLADEVLGLLARDAQDHLPLGDELPHLAAEVLHEASAPSLPPSWGPYRIVETLGEGGMGTVYLAERPDIGGRVAIKVLRDAALSPARRERFAAEQQTLARLSHPGIAQIHDAGTLDDGTPWFAMEYVDGVPVTEYCRSRKTSVEGRLELFRAVCVAVQHAHGQAVIHRDLKPSNVLARPDGTIKLVDFGISKHLESTGDAVDQTRTGLRLLTPAYASPEQVRGGPVGIQSDVYSLGVLLFELLADRRPFDLSRRTPAEAASIIAHSEPPRLSTIARDRPRGEGPSSRTARRIPWSDLDVLCQVCLRKDPQRRYPTVEALIRDLDHYLAGEPLEARADSFGYRFGKLVGRHRAAVLAGTGTMVVIVGLIAFYTLRLTRAHNEAVEETARAQRIQRFMLSLFEGGDEVVAPAEELRVLELIDRGVEEASGLASEPAVQAELYTTLGGICRQLGDFPRADRLLQLALDGRRKLHGPVDHPDVAASLVALALLRSDEARYEEAEHLAREALALSRKTRQGSHPGVADATGTLGHVLVERGAYTEAIELLEETVRLQSPRGENAPALAGTLHELSNAHFYAGELDVAESISRRVLAMSRTLYGADHPHVADDLVNLGAIQHEQGRYLEAERFFREALVITRAWRGEEHHQTAANLTMLGRTLVFQDRLDEASDALQQALAIQEGVFGPDHPRVASTLNDLGAVALQRDDHDRAEASFRRMVEIYRRAHPGEHYLVGVAISNLASVHQDRQAYAEAERLYRESIAIFGRTLPAGHMNTAIARIKLGRSLLRQQRYEEAARESLAGYEIVSAQADPSVGWLRSASEDLFAAYVALGREDDAARFRPTAEPSD